MTRHRQLWLELLVLYAGVPLLILQVRDRLFMFTLLWLAAGATFWLLRRKGLMVWNGKAFKAGLPGMALRFALLAPCLALIVWWWLPAHFLSLPLERPLRWLMILLVYPLLSVWPQEMVYRAFPWHRYQPVLGHASGYIIASALIFGFMHVIFLNWLAVAMTAASGLMFAANYRTHRSLTLVCLEHALYGGLVFTIGLGRFFFSGAAWS